MYCKKIVFTGGPCAGKSTMIERLKEYLKEKGYTVVVVPETATEMHNMGIGYKMIRSVPIFQKLIFDYQKVKEDSVETMLRVNSEDSNRYVVIYDRGIIDNKAYFDDSKGFDKLLGDNYSELNILDSYDYVFNLITLADCNKEKYNLSSNEARTESPEDAIKRDRKTSNAWTGHRNIKIINTSITEDEEFEIIKNKVDELMEGINRKEIKSIELDNDIYDFYKYNDVNSRLIEIEEQILSSPGKQNVIYKIYKRTYKGNTTFILNVSYIKDNILTTIYDNKITDVEYKNIINEFKIKDIIKYSQLSFIEERQEYNIKFYNDKTMLEYEENKLNKEFKLPEAVRVKDNSYKRDNLLKPILKSGKVKQNIIV